MLSQILAGLIHHGGNSWKGAGLISHNSNESLRASENSALVLKAIQEKFILQNVELLLIESWSETLHRERETAVNSFVAWLFEKCCHLKGPQAANRRVLCKL